MTVEEVLRISDTFRTRDSRVRIRYIRPMQPAYSSLFCLSVLPSDKGLLLSVTMTELPSSTDQRTGGLEETELIVTGKPR